MVFFVPGGVIAPEVQWKVGNVSMGLMAFLFLVNLAGLVFLSVKKVMLWQRRKKAMKLYKKAKADKSDRVKKKLEKKQKKL